MPHTWEESINIKVVIALCDEAVQIFRLHEWFQFLAPSFKGYLVFLMEVHRTDDISGFSALRRTAASPQQINYYIDRQ